MVQSLAKSVSENLSPIEGELDSKIAPLVLAMREVGFDMLSCCEGHFKPDSFKHLKPNVVFTALDRGLLHAWIREISITEVPEEVLSLGIVMFPVWNSERSVVHEDNWSLEIDMSSCSSSAAVVGT